jgi:hypothetical protein
MREIERRYGAAHLELRYSPRHTEISPWEIFYGEAETLWVNATVMDIHKLTVLGYLKSNGATREFAQ